MSQELVEVAFCAFVKAAVTGHPAFTLPTGEEYPFYVSAETGELDRTCMGFTLAESTYLHPRTRTSKGMLNISVETQAVEGETQAVHTARCNALEGVLRGSQTLVAAINSQRKFHLYFFAVAGCGRETNKDRAWTTVYDVSVGYGPPLPPAPPAP